MKPTDKTPHDEIANMQMDTQATAHNPMVTKTLLEEVLEAATDAADHLHETYSDAKDRGCDLSNNREPCPVNMRLDKALSRLEAAEPDAYCCPVHKARRYNKPITCDVSVYLPESRKACNELYVPLYAGPRRKG